MGRRVIVSLFVLLAAAVTIEAVGAWADAITGAGARAWLDAGYMTLKAGVAIAFGILVARRGSARRPRRGVTAVIACAAAMLALLTLERPDESTARLLVIAGEAVALLAAGWMLVSTVALGRCFGVLPEARGLVTDGPYRLVRHPLYLGELGACFGLVLASPSTRNLFAAATFAAAQMARMRMEESELTFQFPEYKAYAARTPRLIPITRGQGEAA
jgi:protein-S-isoprenylcysteine O-methyltransferase Ste14